MVLLNLNQAFIKTKEYYSFDLAHYLFIVFRFRETVYIETVLKKKIAGTDECSPKRTLVYNVM